MNADIDYYEVLQISTTAEPETVHRVYRLLAQRCHPDNAQTGSEEQFRVLSEAYHVISDPERRAQYDIVHARQSQERWRLVESGPQGDNDFEGEQQVRLAVLEVLYTRRRIEPSKPGISPLELEKLLAVPREHLEFTTWFLVQKKFVTRSDSSSFVITAEGVEYLETHHQVHAQRRRLSAGTAAA